MEQKQAQKKTLSWWLVFIGLVTVFTLAYAQSPLFTSNQNQYFFFGMANAGFGDLKQDWLYSTHDIVPVFSFLVSLTISVLQATWVFYLYYAGIFALYLYSMYGILAHVFQWERTNRNLLIFGAAATALHSAAFRFILSTIISPEWEYLFEGGVAGQRVLGDVFQPSSFGVLFLLSILLFLKEKPYGAIVVSALAAVIHPTYLLSAGVLTLTYCLLRWKETGKMKEPVALGLIALIIVAPIIIYTANGFLGVDPSVAAQANDITINYRQPHHMIIANWFDLRVIIKAVLLSGALFILQKTRLFWVLSGPTIAVVVLTAIQARLQHPALAMLFPWRFSVVLVPLATMILAGKAINNLLLPLTTRKKTKSLIYSLAAIVLLGTAAAGVYKFTTAIRQQRTDPAYEMMTMIRDQYEPGQVVVVPLKWQQFRLVTGIPIVVEFKAGPQEAEDIVEWYQRVQQVDHLYAGLPYGEGCMRWEYLQFAYGATHLVLPNNLAPDPACMKLLFQNTEFCFYERVRVK